MRICFGPGENPREALQVLSDEKITAARRAMLLVNEAPDLEVIQIGASVGDDREDVDVEALVSREGNFGDGSWERRLKLDAKSRLGTPTMGTNTTDGERRRYTTVIGGVTVHTVLRRRFP